MANHKPSVFNVVCSLLQNVLVSEGSVQTFGYIL